MSPRISEASRGLVSDFSSPDPINLNGPRPALERQLGVMLRQVVAEYPEIPQAFPADVVCHPAFPLWAQRTAYDMSLVLERTESADITVVDVGGGRGLFSLGFARVGARSILIDDFVGIRDASYGSALFDLMQRSGVEVIEQDAISDPPDLPSTPDVITAFHFMEHVHNSPRPLFRRLVDQMSPGGTFVIGGPNCVNLRKRVTAPLGKNKWSSMEDWYESPVFRGHVREHDVGDLRYIARDLGLENVSIHGRNFFGVGNPRRGWRAVARAVDPLLRLRPALCSEIYLLADKPAGV